MRRYQFKLRNDRPTLRRGRRSPRPPDRNGAIRGTVPRFFSRCKAILNRLATSRPVQSSRVDKLLFVLGGILCLVWVIGASDDLLQDAQSSARLAELKPLQAASAEHSAVPTPTPTPSSPTATPSPTAPPAPTVLPHLALLLDQNPDLAGWLSIEGTVIDYPVMFTPQDEEHYLQRNFDGKPDKNGSLFIQKDCDPFTPGTNIIIHGHNMKSGRMFGDLDKYKKESYWEKHPVIRFDTLYEQGEYEIIAVFLSQVYNRSDEVFKYYQFIRADTQAEFDDYVGNIKCLALYDTGVSAHYGDSFITFSTCAYHVPNGRLVVVARKVEQP